MRILVVDDDPITRLTLETLLAQRGCEVVTAIDGEEAYDLLQREDAPKLAIVDWMMPGMSGPELCRKLRESKDGRRTHVIMLTGKRAKEDLVTGLEAGADDYVRKPFDIDELYARVRAAYRLVTVQDQLRSQANKDDLTGLLNRAAILEFLRRALEQAARDDNTVSILLADVDRFKLINDTHGHPIGDNVLRQMGRLLQTPLRLYDAVGRYGGEEFLVVLPGCGGEAAVEVAERLRSHVCRRGIQTPAGALSITVSVGIATSAGGFLRVDDLILAADKALYRAKHAGRNCVAGPLTLEDCAA
jgi:diguanylate cyclase (GGDEF)-like protein